MEGRAMAAVNSSWRATCTVMVMTPIHCLRISRPCVGTILQAITKRESRKRFPGLFDTTTVQCDQIPSGIQFILFPKGNFKITHLDAAKLTKPNLEHLECISISECTDARVHLNIVELVASCPQLTNINLRATGMSRSTVECIVRSSPYLQVLDLTESTSITHQDIATITEHCPLLHTLGLLRCSGLNGMTMLPKQLRRLNVYGCQLKDADLSVIAKCCLLLQSLDVSKNSLVTDGGITEVASACRLLQEFEMWECPITDKSLQTVARCCPKLTNIDISKCNMITDAALSSVIQNCPKLQTVNAWWCDLLTNASVLEISKNLRDLTHLDISKCSNVTDLGICAISQKCTKLRVLQVYGCPLTDISLQAVARYLPGLDQIDLSGCDITDSGLCQLAEACMNLCWVDLTNISSLTDEGVIPLVDRCRASLQTLKFSHCSITDNTLKAVSTCNKLAVLHVGRCELLSPQAVLQFVSHCPSLRVLKVSNDLFTKAQKASLQGTLELLELC
jgi:hypothetical protein